MSDDTKNIFWTNAQALLKKRFGRGGIRPLARAAEVGNATVLRMRDSESRLDLEVIERTATNLSKNGHQVQPWHLLYPGLNPDAMPQILPYSEMAVQVAKALDAIKDEDERTKTYIAFMTILRVGVTKWLDEFNAPVAATPAPAPPAKSKPHRHR